MVESGEPGREAGFDGGGEEGSAALRSNRGVSGRTRRVAGCTSHLRAFIPLYYPPRRLLVHDVAVSR